MLISGPVMISRREQDPKEAALVVYVDRKNLPSQLPPTLGGLRTRYVIMDRLHVTRSYATGLQTRSHCMVHGTESGTGGFDPQELNRPRGLDLK